MDVSADQVRRALLALVAFVVSVSVHEFGHAFVADRLGDRLPRAQGRLTLSPLAHIDQQHRLAPRRRKGAWSSCMSFIGLNRLPLVRDTHLWLRGD